MNNTFETLKHISKQKFRQSLPLYKRFLFDKVKNSKDKIVGIYGSRGVGKTTLMLQMAKEIEFDTSEMMYISCDHPSFNEISLFELCEYFSSHGGRLLIIDEIHEAKNFEQELKSIYDFLDINILFSGSSAIKITNASFARRYSMLKLPILSLREFCEIKHDLDLPNYSIEELLTNHENISDSIIDKLNGKKILKLYNQYLQVGAYPYYFVNEESFFQKVTDSINAVLYTDIALLYNVNASNIEMLKKLLYTISLSKPLELSMETLSKSVGVSKSTLYNYIEYLHRSELLRHVVFEGKRFRSMQKPDKLYLSNTTILNSLTKNIEVGTQRETFFASQVASNYSIHYVSKGDFLVDEKYTFEIGGKNKGFDQIKDIPNSFVVADDIEAGLDKKIPLWLFGFLY